ncbi:hypothetical protein G210_3355 [Candida maltosa Xu316]|uniref:Uncharacterized protein n=1 Tax=Candida maltosa (strain Xu316) TaxID=1245528 RepID=M3JU53_CANMX|nr:hypothetical protein G210_3355 [Candida maltosa Xu316]
MHAFNKSKKSKKKINWWRKTILLGSMANKKYMATSTAAMEPHEEAMATTLCTNASCRVNLNSWFMAVDVGVGTDDDDVVDVIIDVVVVGINVVVAVIIREVVTDIKVEVINS